MKILTVEEVAKILKVNKFTIYRHIQKGIIPAISIGGNWRISEEELNEWLKKKSGKTTTTRKLKKSV